MQTEGDQPKDPAIKCKELMSQLKTDLKVIFKVNQLKKYFYARTITEFDRIN